MHSLSSDSKIADTLGWADQGWAATDTVYNLNSCHVSACPEASALLNPSCCVVSGVSVTDSSWGYFLLLSTVWAFVTNGSWLEWLGQLEWQWLIALWRGWQSEVSWGDRWATVSHWGGRSGGRGETWPVEYQSSSPAALAVYHLKGQPSIRAADLLCLPPDKTPSAK